MDHGEHRQSRPFFKPPLALALIGFLAVAAFLLITQHRAHLFTGGWLIWLLPLGCVVMHLFHGGHGGHGGSDDAASKKG